MAKISFTVVRLGSSALIWADRPLGGSITSKLRQALAQLDADHAQPIVVDLVRVPALDEGVIAVLAEAAGRDGGLELRLSHGRAATVTSAERLRGVLGEAFPSAA